MVDINTAGEIEGFGIRPEIAKVIMWRENGEDLGAVY